MVNMEQKKERERKKENKMAKAKDAVLVFPCRKQGNE